MIRGTKTPVSSANGCDLRTNQILDGNCPELEELRYPRGSFYQTLSRCTFHDDEIGLFFVISRTQPNTALVITSANKTLLQCCRLFSSMISLSKHQKFQNWNKNKASHSSILIHIHFHNQSSSICPQGRLACFTYSNSFPFMSYFPAKARSTNAEVGHQLTLRKQWSTLRTLLRRRKRYSRALHSQLSSRY